jgi:hypothetical protein
MFVSSSRVAVLESWKALHDDACEKRYIRIDDKLDKIDGQFDSQTSEFRAALKEHSIEQAAARRGIYKLLWTAVGSLIVMLVTGMATLIYNLLPTLHH